MNQQKMLYGVLHTPAMLNALLDADEFEESGETETDPKKKKKKERMILATVKLKGKKLKLVIWLLRKYGQ